MKSDDLNILINLKLEKPRALKELFDVYYVPLCIYALKYCDSFSQAENIVQDLFVKFWDKKIYLKLENQIAPYLYKAVKNNALKIVKKNSKYRFETIENRANDLIFEEKYDPFFSDKDVNKEKLHQTIETLPNKSKEVFKAIVLGDLKYKEVALELGISVNTVKTHYSRALKQLRSSLQTIILLHLFLFV